MSVPSHRGAVCAAVKWPDRCGRFRRANWRPGAPGSRRLLVRSSTAACFRLLCFSLGRECRNVSPWLAEDEIRVFRSLSEPIVQDHSRSTASILAKNMRHVRVLPGLLPGADLQGREAHC